MVNQSKHNKNQNSKPQKFSLNIQNFTRVHRQVGILFMPLLLIIVITGGWSLFRAELMEWQFPKFELAETSFENNQKETELPSSETIERKSLQELVDIARNEHGFNFSDFSIHDKERFGNFLLFFNKTDGQENLLFMDPVTGEALDSSQASFSETVYDLHLKLLLPSSFGKYLVGLMGLLLTYLIATGFLAHKNIGKNFYQLRLHKGRQIFTTDLHKLLGNWSLVFTALMSITGALLGIFMLILLVLALAAYGGDVKALFADFLGTQPQPVGGIVDYMSLDSLYQLALQQWEGYKISVIEIHNYADPAMRVTFEGELMNGFLTQQHVTFDAINGGVTFITDFTDKGAGGYMYSALPSLHFASYGGLWLKLIYWFLTLILLLVMVTGITIKSLRLKQQPFSIADRIVIALSQAVVLTASIAVLFGTTITSTANPGDYQTLGILTLIALLYTIIQRIWLAQYTWLNSVALAGYILVLTGIIALIQGKILVMTLCVSLGFLWLFSQKLSTLVASAADRKSSRRKSL
ncbi:PepSY-associated TM helix domain-containing protein [Kangiella koreensis]|uniref:PepSY-associated TM helix domain protein n=1 Tax=Kangiella koreensis (strain DSM 16069 / JCM 12317 / KCTC 12182 / SW-125) TaxID=523791 RepID=C7R700_KANKD|nr:PepSY-associated TM helix domain-containing protein [Kangiella koreensis]ACV27456.1 PepSY-associated TM helix domain protein [Kangiella koreensis DSM 16069]